MRKYSMTLLLLISVLLIGCGSSESKIDQYAQMIKAEGWSVTICHYPPGNEENPQTLTIGHPAVLAAHLKNHDGDHLGPCTCEDYDNCDDDCECDDDDDCPPPDPECGDQECNGEETCATCPLDCGVCPPVCGDAVCHLDETCEDCPEDCGECPPPPPFCGDEICDITESCETCILDCGECNECSNDTSCCELQNCCPDYTGCGCQGDNCGSGGDPDGGINEPDAGTVPVPDAGVTPPINPPVDNGPKYAFSGGCNVHGEVSGVANGLSILFLGGLFLTFLFCSWIFPDKKWLYRLLLITFSLCTTSLVYAFPASNVNPTPGQYDTWVTESATAEKPRIGLLWQYENDPLKLIDKETGKTVQEVIRDRHMLYLMGSYSFFDRLQLGAVIPLVLHQDGAGGIGNLRLLSKVNILNYEYFKLGAAFNFGVPTSTVEYVNDEGFTVTPKLLIGTKIWKIDITTNAGVEIQDAGDVVTDSDTDKVVVNTSLVASVGTRAHLYDTKQFDLDLVTDVFTRMPLRDQEWRNVPIELISGVEATLWKAWSLQLGAGTALTSGVGGPDYRLLAGVSYTFGLEEECKKIVSRPVIHVVQQPPQEVPVPVAVPIPILKRVYFPFDQHDLTLEAQATILDNIDTLNWAKENNIPVRVVVLVGRTDKRGSDDYNNELSQKRVESVRNFMVSKGFDTFELKIQADGETSANQQANTELEMAQDRVVVTFILLEE